MHLRVYVYVLGVSVRGYMFRAGVRWGVVGGCPVTKHSIPKDEQILRYVA